MNRIVLLIILLLLSSSRAYSEFNPPRIIQIVRGGRDTGALLDSAARAALQERTYYLDRGTEANIKIGNVLRFVPDV